MPSHRFNGTIFGCPPVYDGSCGRRRARVMGTNYFVFKARFFRPFVSRQGPEKYSPYHIGSMLYGLPPVSRRGLADHSDFLPVKRSPLTNTDENAGICSESVELTQRFTKSFQVWEMMGGKWASRWLGAGDMFVEDGGAWVAGRERGRWICREKAVASK